MMPLIPTIEIGKKYLCKEAPVEYLCPHCQHSFCSHRDVEIVEIIAHIPAYNNTPHCPNCMRDLERSLFEGWYAARYPDGIVRGGPYTQLEEIKEGGD